MTVQQVIDMTLRTTPIKIESHWHCGVEYELDSIVVQKNVEAILVRDNMLVISI